MPNTSQTKLFRVLFLDYANRLYSPLMEIFLRKKLQAYGVGGVEIKSAGIDTHPSEMDDMLRSYLAAELKSWMNFSDYPTGRHVSEFIGDKVHTPRFERVLCFDRAVAAYMEETYPKAAVAVRTMRHNLPRHPIIDKKYIPQYVTTITEITDEIAAELKNELCSIGAAPPEESEELSDL